MASATGTAPAPSHCGFGSTTFRRSTQRPCCAAQAMKRSAKTAPARWVWRSPPLGMRWRKARSVVRFSRAASKVAAVMTVSNSPASTATRNKTMKAASKMTARMIRRRKACPLRSLQRKASGWVGRTQSRHEPQASAVRAASASVAVLIRLIRAVDGHADIGRLLVRHFRQLDADLGEVEPRDLLVEAFRQGIDFFLVLLGIGPQLDLRQRLVGKRGRHHEARMAHGIAEVHQAPL